MALFTLRAAGENRAPQFGSTEGDLDAEMLAIAGAMIRQRAGNFEPSAPVMIAADMAAPLRLARQLTPIHPSERWAGAGWLSPPRRW